mmetsp:Transcript_12983/g.52299  ORF Transcript_12983/g.52299 Transcript_12983/m.52299 type:complete len:259 (-) Transcript_12983:1374-2150(-)
MVAGGCDRMARCEGPPPLPTVPPRPWKSVSFTPNSSATFVAFSCPSYSAQAAAMRPASLPESEYPIITSWWPAMSSWYHGMEKSLRSWFGPSLRSSRRSNSGATRRSWSILPPISRWSKTTASTSDATVAMEMTYVPREPGHTSWRCAIILKVSSTSRTSSVHSRSGATSGRLDLSSDTSHSVFFSSSHSLYDPRPMCRVMASTASACRSLSCRMSSLTRDKPKQFTWRIRSSSEPSATVPSPTSMSDWWHAISGSSR